ncbi:leucine-rich repeat domain-containing protein [Microbacterium sp.]|uniref:leucine-rich repeat domain-containing protein n=1 Tax=Microbacterium sp. TaxID=51671 RepID=UPI0039E2AC6C
MGEVIEAPQKATEVKAWLAAHANPDPAVLLPIPKQKASAKVAAVRALGAIGGPAAFEVLSQYASDGKYSDAMLKELHVAWGAFDRHDFAATMFNSRVLRLGMTTNVTGLDAVADLCALDIIVPKSLDLAPLAACQNLRELNILVYDSGTLDLSFLEELPCLEHLDLANLSKQTNLAPLAHTSLKSLCLPLDGQAGDVLLQIDSLERLQVSGGVQKADHSSADPSDVDPGLIDVVVRLVQRGVSVVTYRHEKSWVPRLVETAAAAGLFSTESNGYVGLTNDAAEINGLERRMFNNHVTGLYL